MGFGFKIGRVLDSITVREGDEVVVATEVRRAGAYEVVLRFDNGSEARIAGSREDGPAVTLVDPEGKELGRFSADGIEVAPDTLIASTKDSPS